MYINPCTTIRTAKIFPWYPASETDAKPVRRSSRVEVLIRAGTTPAQVDFQRLNLHRLTDLHRDLQSYRLKLTVRFTDLQKDLQTYRGTYSKIYRLTEGLAERSRLRDLQKEFRLTEGWSMAWGCGTQQIHEGNGFRKLVSKAVWSLVRVHLHTL